MSTSLQTAYDHHQASSFPHTAFVSPLVCGSSVLLLTPGMWEFSILTLVLNRKEPDLELEGLLKRHSTTVSFYQGSIMSAVDLARVKVNDPPPPFPSVA